MRKLPLVLSVSLIFLSACGPATTPGPSPTPVPPSATPIPPTSTPVPSGIDGSIRYAGPSQGGLLIFAMDHLPEQNEAPSPTAISTFPSTSGEFHWDLPPGVYYVLAFVTIGRPPEGPPQANEPVLNCDAVEVVAGARVALDVILTDDDVGGGARSCLASP